MTRHFSTKSLVGFSIFATLLLFAFSGSHPTTSSGGYTGAPNDNVCTTCHTPGGSLDGNIAIGGLPSSVMANTTYPLTITITNTAGSAVRAGFQMVSLKTNLANGGTFSVPVSENNAQVKTAAGKSYVGHQPAKNFAANEVLYNVEWTAPASATGDITVYAAAMIANGANGNSGDKFVTTNMAVTLGGGGDPLSGTFSNIVDASCSDTNDGSATINAMGGSGNYMYNWDNGESNATAIMLSGGLHSVTVTDDSSGEIIETVTIGAPTAIVPSIIFQTDAVCNGEMSGAAEVSATGGTPGFNYNWGSGITGAIQNNLAAGNYVVTVTDLNNCTAEISVFINQPTPIDINIINLDQPTCNGDDDGSIEVSASGGNSGFTYNWLDGIGVPSGGTLSLLPAGDYQVEVVDAQGCTNQTTITLGEPDAVDGIVVGFDVQCTGENTGTASAEGAGGSGGYTYNWSNGETGPTQSGLTAGEYIVTISDSDNCSIAIVIEISEPLTAVMAGITTINQPNCGNLDGELSAFGLGGTPDYTYLWDTGETSAVLSNIGSGIYTVTVTDLNNCTAESTITLEDNDGVTLAANDVGNNTCFGDTEGTATITASGGSGIYTYTWSNGGTNQTENNLPAGQYSITVTDDGNCTGEISIEITEPDAFEANETLIDITCNGAENGSIQLNTTGGTGNLTYLWNTEDTTDGITDLIAGIFSVTVTDENSCTGEIEFVIAEPDPIITGIVDSNSPSCTGDMDGFISLNPSGGTGDLSFQWSNGDTTMTADSLTAGDYSVTISDENNCDVVFDFTLDDAIELNIGASTSPTTCNGGQDGSAILIPVGGNGEYNIEWSTGDSTLQIFNLSAGTYSVTVTDGNGCSTEADIEVFEPLAIDPNITTTNESSNGAGDGSAISDPLDGVAPYAFLWSTGDTISVIQNLSPGSYGLTITDSNGCTATATALINNGDCDITGDVEVQNILCSDFQDGSISVVLTGAIEPVEYNWSNGSMEATLTDLGPGEYSVTITDANGCQLQITDIPISEPPPITATGITVTDASSSTSSDGSIEIEFSGGIGELTIVYYDVSDDPIEIPSFENLSPGIYNAVATDEIGCSVSYEFIVDFMTALEDINRIMANIYPNPAQSFFIIESDTELASEPELYNVSGQMIDSNIELNSGNYKFDTNHLSNGVYYIKLVSKSDIVLKKIIITK